MTDSDYYSKVVEASEYIRSQISDIPDVCLVLGSGLGPLTERVETISTIPYEEIPHFPRTTVAGHDGKLLVATLSGRLTFIMRLYLHGDLREDRSQHSYDQSREALSGLWS